MRRGLPQEDPCQKKKGTIPLGAKGGRLTTGKQPKDNTQRKNRRGLNGASKKKRKGSRIVQNI